MEELIQFSKTLNFYETKSLNFMSKGDEHFPRIQFSREIAVINLIYAFINTPLNVDR